MQRRLALLGLVGALNLVPATASAKRDMLPKPAVARPVLQVGGETLRIGTVFFLSVDPPGEAVAVGTAHSLPLDKLARAGELRFELGASERSVSVSSRYHIRPGRPFHTPGATLRDDYLIFALDLAPEGVRFLDPDVRIPAVGTRVRLLGISATIPADEDDVYGTVSRTSDTRIEVDLDVPVDLRGWGGAPLLDDANGTVIGMLQAAFPRDTGLTIAATPIGAIIEALESPLDQGRGRPFSAFSTGAAAEDEGGTVTSAAQPTAASPSRKQPSLAEDLSAVSEAMGEEVTLFLEIDHPPDGAVIGDPLGAFIAGRTLAALGEFRRLDLAFVIDTSGSTSLSTGIDVNGNGIVGEDRMGGLFGNTDRGDSILAAEVAAARSFVARLDPRSTRVTLISFAGMPGDSGGGFVIGRPAEPPAITEVPLTARFAEIERGLDGILDRGPSGATHMAAGADRATIELLGLQGALSDPTPKSEKVVIFLTDGQPTLPYEGMGGRGGNTRAVFRAGSRARRARVKFHTFGIGKEALEGPAAIVELAKRTGGTFTPVRQPGDLVDVVEQVNFLNIESIEVTNTTSGAVAGPVLSSPDGSWSALVPLQIGENRLRAVARTVDGDEIEAFVTVHHAPGAADPLVPRELVATRNALLERRLLGLRRDRLSAEHTLAEKTRAELSLEIEKERAAAEQRAAAQRKELELEVEPDPSRGAEPGKP